MSRVVMVKVLGNLSCFWLCLYLPLPQASRSPGSKASVQPSALLVSSFRVSHNDRIWQPGATGPSPWGQQRLCQLGLYSPVSAVALHLSLCPFAPVTPCLLRFGFLSPLSLSRSQILGFSTSTGFWPLSAFNIPSTISSLIFGYVP